MIYSRKGLWIARGAIFMLLVVWIVLARSIRPPREILPWVGALLVLTVFALAIRAYFCLDEIQRTARMRAWYYGTALGIAVSFIAVICLRARPDLLGDFVDWMLGHRSPPPLFYFVAGVMFILLAQMAGYFAVRAFMALPKRNP